MRFNTLAAFALTCSTSFSNNLHLWGGLFFAVVVVTSGLPVPISPPLDVEAREATPEPEPICRYACM